jgi:hypothetical protein
MDFVPVSIPQRFNFLKYLQCFTVSNKESGVRVLELDMFKTSISVQDCASRQMFWLRQFSLEMFRFWRRWQYLAIELMLGSCRFVHPPMLRVTREEPFLSRNTVKP